MKYQVLDRLKAKTPHGEMELQPGQVITLPPEKATELINKGKITPIEVAYKVYSEILQACLWVVADDKDMQILRDQGATEAIYAADEINSLKDIDKDSLRAIHRVKEVFKDSKIKKVKK